MPDQKAPDRPVRIGVSTCLLGEAVRWDGGHKREAFLLEGLGPRVELVPICPELELGLGVPREPIRLLDAGSGEGVRLVAEASGLDHTEAMRSFARERVRGLVMLSLSGYVLKRGSPSCGLQGVPVWPPDAACSPRYEGQGLFAAALRSVFPGLPMEEEDRLRELSYRERWMARVFAFHERAQRGSS